MEQYDHAYVCNGMRPDIYLIDVRDEDGNQVHFFRMIAQSIGDAIHHARQFTQTTHIM